MVILFLYISRILSMLVKSLFSLAFVNYYLATQISKEATDVSEYDCQRTFALALILFTIFLVKSRILKWIVRSVAKISSILLAIEIVYPNAFKVAISIGKKLIKRNLTDLMRYFQVVLNNTFANHGSYHPFLSVETNLYNDIGMSVMSLESILYAASSWIPCACFKDKVGAAVVTENFLHMLQEDMLTVSIDTLAFKHVIVGIALSTIL